VSRKSQFILLVLAGLLIHFEARTAVGSCTVSATPVGFGSYDVFMSVPSDSAGTLTVDCMSNVVRARITAGPSQASGTFIPRQMKREGGTDLLNYNVFTDAARSAIFGDGTGGTSAITIRRPTGKPAPWMQFINIYGRIFPGQDVWVGSYSDSFTITIEW
jgi:spore coat protein U-like protein